MQKECPLDRWVSACGLPSSLNLRADLGPSAHCDPLSGLCRKCRVTWNKGLQHLQLTVGSAHRAGTKGAAGLEKKVSPSSLQLNACSSGDACCLLGLLRWTLDWEHAPGCGPAGCHLTSYKSQAPGSSWAGCSKAHGTPTVFGGIGSTQSLGHAVICCGAMRLGGMHLKGIWAPAGGDKHTGRDSSVKGR